MLRVGESGVAPSEVDRLLEGVYLELAPVMVDAGADYVAAADGLALVAGLDAGTRAQLSIDLGADQLTALNGITRPERGRRGRDRFAGGRLRRRCTRDHG